MNFNEVFKVRAVKSGMKTKGIYIDGLLMQDIVEKIYRTINIEELFGEPGRIMIVEILEASECGSMTMDELIYKMNLVRDTAIYNT